MKLSDRELLRSRAEELAEIPAHEESLEVIEVLEFTLEPERYAIETRYVREVHPLRDVTDVPCTPPFVLGIISVRGQIVSVVDIRRFLELSERGLVDRNRVVIIEDDDLEFGILADSISGVSKVRRDEIHAPPATLGKQARFLAGVTADHVVVLDGSRLLGDRALIVEEEGAL